MSLTGIGRERWERRLEAWAEWVVVEARGGKVKISSLYGSIGAGAYGGQSDGAPNAEILDTHSLICRLTQHLHRALIAWYAETGSPGSKANRLGCSERTLYRRVEAAIEHLDRLHREVLTIQIKRRRALTEKA